MRSSRRKFLKQAGIAAALASTSSTPQLAASRTALQEMARQTPASAIAQRPGDGLALARARHLQRGINASMWFAQSRDYSVERLRAFTTPKDIALIAAMGFDHVRVSIDAAPLLAWHRAQPVSTDFMRELDRSIETILHNGLSAIVDVHPESSYKARLFEGDTGVENFAELWRALADHFRSTDPGHVFLEILNEPEQADSYRWQGIESTVAVAIRDAAPQHTIIAAGAHWSGLEDLLALEPIALPNIIYTFHDYEPFPFTHQGATWTDPRVRPLRGIPYPSTPQDVAPLLKEEPSLSAQYFLDQYGLDRWNAARVENTIAYAKRWSQLHSAPVYCGEFGVFRDYAPATMRAEWLHDMRMAFDKNGIGWAMWDYQANFGVVTKANGVITPDLRALHALGLHAPAS
ncbi:MAG: cellulase family glycosylhydrolase [Acidobacteriaceae bacterium]